MKHVDFDRADAHGLVKGPIIVRREQVIVDPTDINERDVKRFMTQDTQRWYFEPIECVRLADNPDKYQVNVGGYQSSKVEACWRLGYKDLQICYVVERKTVSL